MNDELEGNKKIIFDNKNSYNFENSPPIISIKNLIELASKVPDKLICLFFWANTCKNCFAPNIIFEKVREEFGEEIIFYKINIQESGELVKEFSIKGVPSLIFLKKGKMLKKIVSIPNYSTLKRFLLKIKGENS